MDCVRVGLIGCGSVAESELDGLDQVRGARVVATADPVEQRARLLAHRAGGARAYGDYRRLLEDREVDAVIISTPNFLHARQTIDAAQAGKHVLVQKPLALTLDDIDDMDRATRDAGVTSMALMVMRFQSSYMQLKEAARQPLDGRPAGVPNALFPLRDRQVVPAGLGLVPRSHQGWRRPTYRSGCASPRSSALARWAGHRQRLG